MEQQVLLRRPALTLHSVKHTHTPASDGDCHHRAGAGVRFFFLTSFQLWWFSAQSFHLWTQISIILWAVMRGRSTVWTDAPFLTVSEETSNTNLEQGAKFVLCFNDCIKPPTQTCFSFFTFSRHRIYSFRFYSSSSVVALIQGQKSPLGDMNAEVLLSIEPLQFVMGTKL